MNYSVYSISYFPDKNYYSVALTFDYKGRKEIAAVIMNSDNYPAMSKDIDVLLSSAEFTAAASAAITTRKSIIDSTDF